MITLSLESIHFKCGDTTKTFEPVIFLSLDEKSPEIVGVGNDLKSSTANKRLDLFLPGSWEQANPTKGEALAAFFEHTVHSICKSKNNIVRPKIIIKNSNSLENIFCATRKIF